jgi:hypothetical protein
MKNSLLLFLALGVLAAGCAPTTSPNQGAKVTVTDGSVGTPPVQNPIEEAPVSTGAEATETDGGAQGGARPEERPMTATPQGASPTNSGGGGRGGRGGLTMVLRNEQVQKELKLSEDQIAKIQAAVPEGMRDMSDGDREKAMDKFQADVKAILTAEQAKRAREIQLQMQGARALTTPEVAKELGLSEKQVADIQQALTVPRPEGGQPGQAPGGGGGFDREAFMKAREEANKKALAILTADQRKRWEAMQGKKFEFQMPQRAPGGAPGGGGGVGS